MSHDQKPGRMRVVGGGAPRRGRTQPPPVDATPPMAAGTAAAITGATVRPRGKASGLLLPALFLAGCAIGGAALPLLRS